MTAGWPAVSPSSTILSPLTVSSASSAPPREDHTSSQPPPRAALVVLPYLLGFISIIIFYFLLILTVRTVLFAIKILNSISKNLTRLES